VLFDSSHAVPAVIALVCAGLIAAILISPVLALPSAALPAHPWLAPARNTSRSPSLAANAAERAAGAARSARGATVATQTPLLC